MLLPETDAAGATAFGEKIRQAVECLALPEVQGDEPLRLGEHLCTLKDLLHLAAEGSAAPGVQPALVASVAGEPVPRVRGRVERDAKTGEIVLKRH